MVTKRCGHKGMREDVHDYCRRCAEKQVGFICDGINHVCGMCENLEPSVWKTINSAVERNVRKRKPGAIVLNMSKTEMEGEDTMSSIDYAHAQPKRHKAATLLFPEDTLGNIGDANTSLLSSDNTTQRSDQFTLEEASKFISQSEDTVIPPSQATLHMTPIPEDTAEAWATYTQSVEFKNWFQEQVLRNKTTAPSATVSKSEIDNQISPDDPGITNNYRSDHESVILSGVEEAQPDVSGHAFNLDHGDIDIDERESAIYKSDSEAEISDHGELSEAASQASAASATSQRPNSSHSTPARPTRETQKSLPDFPPPLRLNSGERPVAPKPPKKRPLAQAAPIAPNKRRALSSPRRHRDDHPRHSTPRRSPFKYPDCGDKIRSPRRERRQRLFSDSSSDGETGAEGASSQNSVRDSNPDPLDAPIKHVLPIIAAWSEAQVGPPHDILDSTNFRLESEGRAYNQNNFVSLTTASGVVKAVQAKMQEFRSRDIMANKAVTFGKPFTTSRMKVSKNMYKGADALLPLNPMSSTPNAPTWLRQSKPDDKINLRERDIAYWEGQARTALRILSLTELINQTQRRGGLRISNDDMEDLLATNIKAIKDLIKISTEWLTQCVQLRRDNILQRCELTADQLFELRHAPVVEDKFLFPEALLKDIHNKHLLEIQNQALRARYSAPPRINYGGGGAFQREKRHRPEHKPRSRHNTSVHPARQPQKGERVFTKASHTTKHR